MAEVPDTYVRERTTKGRKVLTYPPSPEPLAVGVYDNHCHLEIADGESSLTLVEQLDRAQAVGVLADLGYPRRDDDGRAFAPAVHEAVGTVSGEGLVPGTVAQVVRPGYGPDDKILRPAAVVVATRAT